MSEKTKADSLLTFRIKPSLKQWFRRFAQQRGITMSSILQEHIEQLHESHKDPEVATYDY